MDPIYRLLHEDPPRLVPTRLGQYGGLVSVEFHDVCSIPVYGVEIAAIRSDLAGLAAAAQQAADEMSFNYYRWHFVNYCLISSSQPLE